MLRVAYRIVHVLPDKTELDVATVDKFSDVAYYTESPRFMGTWINDRKKLLRYRLGELRIIEQQYPMAIIQTESIREDGQPAYKLYVENGYELEWIVMTGYNIAGYNSTQDSPLWVVDSFTNLALFVEKTFAYDCLQLYDELIKAFSIKGSM